MKKATEILMFLVSTIDREKDATSLDNIPVAYAMKGSSLNCETMRKIINELRNKLKMEGVQILTEVCDGQWYKIIWQSGSGKPLTRLQHQKQIWNDSLLIPKKDMLKTLMDISNVCEEDLKKWSEEDQILMVEGSHTIGNITVRYNVLLLMWIQGKWKNWYVYCF